MNAAGLDEIITEMQTQYDSWKKNKNNTDSTSQELNFFSCFLAFH